MSELGCLSSYSLAIQQTQMSLIRNSVEMQQKTIEILLGDENRSIAPSDFVGQTVDVTL